jgi:U-box domain
VQDKNNIKNNIPQPSQKMVLNNEVDFYNTVTSKVEAASILGVDVPSHFICPITSEVMVHPIVTRNGMNYERDAIIEWLQTGATSCPLTRQPLFLSELATNLKLKDEIAFWTWSNHIPNISCQDRSNRESSHVPLCIDTMKRTRQTSC